MERTIFKFGLWTAVALVLLLALAGAIWGVHFVLEGFGQSPDTWADRIFIWLFLAMGWALIFRRPPRPAGVRLHISRPADLAAKDDITARWRIVNLPYAIGYDMVIVLNDADLPGQDILANIISVDGFVSPENGEWMCATLELHDPNDFERLGKSGEWYEIRDTASKSPAEPPKFVLVGQSPKTIQ